MITSSAWTDANSGCAGPFAHGGLVTERRALEGKLWDLANIDSLTGLSNRILFGERLAAAIRATERTGTSIAVVLLDIDNFKEINDALGHDAGDDVLRQVAQHISASLRETDWSSRGMAKTCVLSAKVRDVAREFRKFLDKIEAAVPDGLEVHLVMDNCATHKTPRGEQRGGPMALVVVAPARRLAGAHRQHGLAAVERLNLRFFVHAQHDGRRSARPG